MKNSKTIVVLLVLFVINTATFASEDTKMARDIYEIKKELREIKEELRGIRRRLEGYNYRSSKWGCYLSDIRAGGISGAGQTKAEAIGIVLEKCSERDGVCFKNDVECSSE